MTRLSANQPCETCGGELYPPGLAFGVIVPSNADYFCVRCKTAYRFVGAPLQLLMLVPETDDRTES
jgi:hypothetical protein